jgi:hypothetical protein
MFEDEDISKANYLKTMGHYPDVDIIELAQMIYERRQQDTNTDGQPQLLRG